MLCAFTCSHLHSTLPLLTNYNVTERDKNYSSVQKYWHGFYAPGCEVLPTTCAMHVSMKSTHCLWGIKKKTITVSMNSTLVIFLDIEAYHT